MYRNRNLVGRVATHTLAVPLTGLLLAALSIAHAAVITVDTATDEALSDITGNCSLRKAIDAATRDQASDGCSAGAQGADEIRFDGDYTINFQSAIFISSEISINAGTDTPPRAVILDGGGSTRIFQLGSSNSKLTLANMTLQNGSSGAGGAILATQANAQISATFVTFDGNEATSSNGGAISTNGDLALSGVIFTNNTADGSGGAISTSGENLIISGGFFGNLPGSGNEAEQNGGALHIVATGSNDKVVLDGVVFVDNIANGDGGERGGGAIWADTSSDLTFLFQITNGTFIGNEAPNGGGGALLVTLDSRIAYVDPLLPFAGGIGRSHFENNSAGADSDPNGAGGAILNRGTMTVVSSSFVNNTSVNGSGGGIAHNSGDDDRNLTIANTTFSANVAGSDGGAIASIDDGGGKVILINATIDGNQAGGAGGGFFAIDSNPAQFAVGNTVISNNVASASGANCGGMAFDDNGGNLESGADDCSVTLGQTALDSAGPDLTSPNPLVWVMQPTDMSTINGSGNNDLCNAAPVSKLDARFASRPQGGANCDSGAYETDGQFVPTGDVIFVDNYQEPFCDSVDIEANFESSATATTGTDDCNLTPPAVASGKLGALDDVDFFSFRVSDQLGCVFDPPVFIVDSTRPVRTCMYYACDTGTANVRCFRGSDSATSELGLPGCCSANGGVPVPAITCPGVSQGGQVIIKVDEPAVACADYSIEARF